MKRENWTFLSVVLALLAASVPVRAQEQQVLVTVESLVPGNGVYFSPVWVGFHDGSFDLFDVGSVASEAIERIAEDGDVSALRAAFAAATGPAGGLDGVITSPAGFPGLPVFDPGETSTATFTLTAAQHRYLSFASMVVPSNDAFIGNHDPRAIELFDAAGTFKGKQIITVPGSMVWDAGTELNTELDAAFINQTAPNTGVPTMSPVLPHPGYLGSHGNPGGVPIILGGVNAAGKLTDPVGADFTLPYAVIARITIEPAPAGGAIQALSVPDPLPGRGNGALGTIYVTSQGLYYDTFVSADSLPYRGRFQKLAGHVTEFGPGDPGYLGGRWWVDDGDGIMEPPDTSGDTYFLCPLLPPGRRTP
jgi:hypothetical protein